MCRFLVIKILIFFGNIILLIVCMIHKFICMCIIMHMCVSSFSDINECNRSDAHNCHGNADCINNNGSFSCLCSTGYSGDGVFKCTG